MPIVVDIFWLSLSGFVLSCAIYVLARVAALPYQLKTDRLWKCGSQEEEPDEPDGEEISIVPHEVIDLRARRTV